MPRSIHTEEYKKFTDVLLQARKQSGLTQQMVADRLGKPQSYVTKIERCERRLDTVEFIAFSMALGADPKDLFQEVIEALKVDTKSSV